VKAKESAGDFGSGYLLDHSSGSGPFIIDHWTKNSEVLLKANPNYGGTKPTLSAVLVKHVPESTNQQFALEKGDADIAKNLSPQQIKALQGKPGVTTASGNSLQLVYVGMNATFKPLDNADVRSVSDADSQMTTLDQPRRLLTRGSLLARNSVLNLIGQGMPFLVAFFALPRLIHGLGTDRFGVLTLAWMVIGYFSLFDLGLSRALTQIVAEKVGEGDDTHAPPVAWTVLAMEECEATMPQMARVTAAELAMTRSTRSSSFPCCQR